MSNIKTVFLSGEEMKVEGLVGQNTIIINKSSGVIEIPAGSRDGLYGTHGTLYLSGIGKVELRGTDYSDLNCGSPSMVSGGGSSGDSGGDFVITKEEIDSLFK